MWKSYLVADQETQGEKWEEGLPFHSSRGNLLAICVEVTRLGNLVSFCNLEVESWCVVSSTWWMQSWPWVRGRGGYQKTPYLFLNFFFSDAVFSGNMALNCNIFQGVFHRGRFFGCCVQIHVFVFFPPKFFSSPCKDWEHFGTSPLQVFKTWFRSSS